MARRILLTLATALLFADGVMASGDQPKHAHKRCSQSLETVDIAAHCSEDMSVTSAIIVTPHNIYDDVLQSGLNCTLTLHTDKHKLLTATIVRLDTAIDSGKCVCNRLDIYDGKIADDANLLSNASGICGCDLADYRNIITTNNSMTLTFKTAITSLPQHGDFNIVIAAVRNADHNMKDCRGEFQCDNGQCINKNLVCDGKYACSDHSDERGCLSHNSSCHGMYTCDDGTCIDKNLVCNGHFDCPDRSDETNCTRHENLTCSGHFECEDGRCVGKLAVCNGIKECADGSDESGCPWYSYHTLVILIVLIAVAGLCLITLVIILIVFCCKKCREDNYVASTYRRMM